MNEKDIPPVIWINSEIYASYIEFIDKRSDPHKQAQHTVEYLFKIADEFDADVSDVFDYLEPNDVILMLHRRQLSPWILLHSSKFKNFLLNKTTDQEKVAMQAIIRPEYWAGMKTKHPDIVSQMKRYVRELDL